MGDLAIHVQWVLIPVFSKLTGYSEKAIRCKIQEGVWLEGKHYRRAPDGRVTMNLPAYYQWVQGDKEAA